MTGEGLSYLRSSPWGAFVFLKFCAGLVYGASDLLNPTSWNDICLGGHWLLHRPHDNGSFHAHGSSSIIGESMPGLLPVDSPWMLPYGLSLTKSFLGVCMFTVVRTTGSSPLWVYSSLLLQKFS
ncbi:LOW QUALITY PROTEIN: hypothetical protein ACHAWF_016985 [Thalassiosira exigua]